MKRDSTASKLTRFASDICAYTQIRAKPLWSLGIFVSVRYYRTILILIYRRKNPTEFFKTPLVGINTFPFEDIHTADYKIESE